MYKRNIKSHLWFLGVRHACVLSPTNFSFWEHCDFLLSKPWSTAHELPRTSVPCHGSDTQCQYWDPAQPMLFSWNKITASDQVLQPPDSKQDVQMGARNQASYSENQTLERCLVFLNRMSEFTIHQVLKTPKVFKDFFPRKTSERLSGSRRVPIEAGRGTGVQYAHQHQPECTPGHQTALLS